MLAICGPMLLPNKRIKSHKKEKCTMKKLEISKRCWKFLANAFICYPKGVFTSKDEFSVWGKSIFVFNPCCFDNAASASA